MERKQRASWRNSHYNGILRKCRIATDIKKAANTTVRAGGGEEEAVCRYSTVHLSESTGKELRGTGLSASPDRPV